MTISVSIVEDNTIFRTSLVQLIQATDGLDLVSEHSNAEDVQDILKHNPDIVLVDLVLPGKNGAELIRSLRTVNQEVKCLVCTGFADEEKIFPALEAGAHGYILKHNSGKEIIHAIREVFAGGSPMSRPVARKVVESFHKGNNATMPLLTERENQVLGMAAEGMVYKEIAKKLGITRETVKKHMKNIFQKLGVQNKIEAFNIYKKGKQ